VNNLTSIALDEILQDFFISIRKFDGEQLKKSSFQSIQYGLNRHFKEHCQKDLTDI
jgi:hypothetical protein